MHTGTIFDIKEFAIYDGPGVRQTVFFKGCSLRCNWCHNPEGLSAKPQLWVGANGNRKIIGRQVAAQELADELLQNADYYAALGGGVTFSGGEPLMQLDFLLELLDLLPNVHIAIETSGFCEHEIFKQVISKIDFVMMDIKHMDSEKHKFHTGACNEGILQNAAWLAGSGTPCVFRVPLIPNVNDSDENLIATAEFLGNNGAKQVELLPYHKTAGAKYSPLGEEYKPSFDPEKVPNINAKPFEQCNIEVSVL